MPSTIGPASITLHGHIDADETVLHKCKVTFAGNVAAVWQWDDETKRFRQFDRIIDFTIVEKKKTMELSGTSETLHKTMHLSLDNSKVRLEVRPQVCEECG